VAVGSTRVPAAQHVFGLKVITKSYTISHRLLGQASPLFIVFVTRCLLDDGWSRRPKHI